MSRDERFQEMNVGLDAEASRISEEYNLDVVVIIAFDARAKKAYVKTSAPENFNVPALIAMAGNNLKMVDETDGSRAS